MYQERANLVYMVQEIEDEPKAMLGPSIYFHLVTLNLRAFYTCSYSHNVHPEHQLTSHMPSLQHFQTPVKQECDNNHITTHRYDMVQNYGFIKTIFIFHFD